MTPRLSYLFVFRTYPDIDHLVPLAWKLLEKGEEVHAVLSPGYDPAGDGRLALLERYDRFTLHRVQRGRGLVAGLGTWLRGTVPWALAMLWRHRVRVVAVEWGYGLAPGYDHPRSARGIAAVARSVAASIVRARRADPHQPRVSYVVAARLLRRATACLPHGLSIKLDSAPNAQMVKKLAAGGLDWRDRNRFSAYVLNTEHHRRLHLDHAKGDPAVMETWGSLRWAPEWFELNRTLAPAFAWPGAEGRLKVVLMVPKWRNRVHPERVLELVRALQELPFVSLAIKGHPRPADGSADPLRDDPAIDWNVLLDATAVESVPLIAAADVVIDVGSSIGLEVVMQEKVLVNPAYIHELRTLFDDIPDSCVRPADDAELAAYLRRHAAGHRFEATPRARAELLRRAVYAERPEPFDVIETYAERFRVLAESSGAA